MLDRDKYDDIAPYNQKESEEACQRIKEHPEFLYAFAAAMFPETDDDVHEKRKAFVLGALSRLDDVHSYDDFQRMVTCDVFLKTVLDISVPRFSFSGQEALDPDQSYLFISNHRDIILDCALTDYALYLNGLPICEMAIGDNLLSNQFILDLFKLNGAIIVHRDLPVRAKYNETIRFSEYLVDRVMSGKSVWLAQKSGRSKDGLDVTHPSIIKMLHLSKKKDGVGFSQVIRDCRIVPVAVSYEHDPNDISKAREEILTKRNGGHYEKSKHEDMFSMVRGLREYKGGVHIAFGTPLTDRDYMTPDEVATEIDRQIHSCYHLYPTNWYCYDYLNGNRDNSDKYKDFDADRFMLRYEILAPEVKTFILESYANPVRSQLAALARA